MKALEGALLAICLSSASASAQISGPAYDCTKARGLDEIAICGDVGLSALDRAANAGYLEVRRQSGQQVANAMGRKFLALRAACRNDKLCIFRQYAAIIRAYKEAGSTVDFPVWAFGDHLPDAAAVHDNPEQVASNSSPPVISVPEAVPQLTAAERQPQPAPSPPTVAPTVTVPTVPAPIQAAPPTASGGSGIGIPWWLILAIVAFIAYKVRSLYRKDKARRAVSRIVASQAAIYAKNRAQMVYEDDYGILVTKAWDKHRKYIANTVLVQNLVQEGFSAGEIASVIGNLDRMDNLIETAALSVPAPARNLDISKVATGVDYEHYCAAILEGAGWTAKVTKGSGDQGVDIIAVRQNWRVVLQCKFYHGQPAGNKAVQEAISGRLHERANAAVVVSNAHFSKPARQLANSGKVLLMHHDELAALDRRLGALGGDNNEASHP